VAELGLLKGRSSGVLFGYLITRALLPLVKLAGLMPRRWTKPFAVVLELYSRPFHVVNYLGSRVGGRLCSPCVMQTMLDRAVATLGQRLARESETTLGHGMCARPKFQQAKQR